MSIALLFAILLVVGVAVFGLVSLAGLVWLVITQLRAKQC